MHQNRKSVVQPSKPLSTQRVKKNDSGITDTVTSVFAERKRERSKEFGSASFQQNENKQSQILKF